VFVYDKERRSKNQEKLRVDGKTETKSQLCFSVYVEQLSDSAF
jgi:hypothetical protein